MRKKKAILRESLGYFENYIEPCGRPSLLSDAILRILLFVILSASIGVSINTYLAG